MNSSPIIIITVVVVQVTNEMSLASFVPAG
jgi:hypothetical protein